MAQVSQGDRAYLKSSGLFGDVTRTNMLNLANSPVLLRDDGQQVGFAGVDTREVVNKATASDGVGSVTVPVDVRLVGVQLLTQAGVSAATQATMFENFVRLSKSERDTYVAAFEAVDQSKPDDVRAFLNSMVQGLTAPR